jgi:hypothetical protein
MNEHAVAVWVVIGVAGEMIAAVDNQYLAASAGQPLGNDRAGKTGSHDQGIDIHDCALQ